MKLRSNQMEHGGRNKWFKIAHLNSQSLRCRSHFTEVRELANKNDFDTLSISETWFDSSVSNANVNQEGYKIYRLDRVNKTGGGVCAYIKSDIKVKQLKELSGISRDSGIHQLCLQVQIAKRKSLVICIAYRPPESPIAYFEQEFFASYSKALSLNKDIVLTGDLNCDLSTKNPKSDALLSFCTSVNATQLITTPTRVTKTSSTIVDVVIVSNPNLVKTSGVMNLSISDHFLVYSVLNLKITKSDLPKITTRSYKKYSIEQFSEDISRIPWDTIDLIDTVDNKLDAFNDLFLTCLDQHAPVKTFRSKRTSTPLINAGRKELMDQRDKQLKIARETGNERDWRDLSGLRKSVKAKIKIAERNYIRNQLEENRQNSASMWKTIRRCFNPSGTSRLPYSRDLNKVADEFNAYF